jgi:hypothetical protein
MLIRSQESLQKEMESIHLAAPGKSGKKLDAVIEWAASEIYRLETELNRLSSLCIEQQKKIETFGKP